MIGPPDTATEAELRQALRQLAARVRHLVDDLDRRARAAGHLPPPDLDAEVGP